MIKLNEIVSKSTKHTFLTFLLVLMFIFVAFSAYQIYFLNQRLTNTTERLERYTQIVSDYQGKTDELASKQELVEKTSDKQIGDTIEKIESQMKVINELAKVHDENVVIYNEHLATLDKDLAGLSSNFDLMIKHMQEQQKQIQNLYKAVFGN